ncbi:uncharacterized protein N0V89_007742 [Didymosphaeria variabile]|uniref:Ankyrin n=1 Tax=Didymosphaeria variabile TaxID=1932322 RepID=A0A9W8XJZ0_9PLEO|nr:uncharacterized protein N0V89_007742 [Didymosphaeria variabile]KAJ4352394.1 hypothetical protein N0V89_007742 [Didymosphaeria variabile]
MSGHSTLAARCAAIGSGIAQIITDTSGIARGLRNARHDINALCADLLAIKVALDIARDDFSNANPNLPSLLLEAASGFLDCCSSATECCHKPIVRLSASQDRTGPWQVLKAAQLTGLKNDLKAVRCALDLLLDLVELFTLPNATTYEITSPNRRSFFDDDDPEVWQQFLERLDNERRHVEDITQGRLPILYASFDKTRACVAFQLEECLSPQASPERPSLQTKRLMVPIPFDLPGAQDKSLPPLPSTLSLSSGIGAWIANVVNQANLSLTAPPPSLALTDPRASFAETVDDDRAPSRGTFYAESCTTTGTQTASSSKPRSPKPDIPERVDSPQLAMKAPKMPKTKKKNGIYTIASTIISSEGRSIIHQRLTNDKIAVAKDTRRRLSRDQKSALDWILKNISSKTTPAEVEQILWEGADPDAADLEFGTVLLRAAHSFSTPILRLLVEYGADMTQTSHSAYYSAIHAAVLGSQLSNLQWLVDVGIYFDTPNQQGETPLHLAVRTPGGYRTAKWLLEIGADVNRETLDGTTPFQMAVGSSKVDSRERSMIIELLLGQGADGEMGKDGASRGRG